MRRLRAPALIVALLAAARRHRLLPRRTRPRTRRAARGRRHRRRSCGWATSPTSRTPPAIIGVEQGLFSKELGGTTLTTQTFNAGGDAVNALLGGSLDATYIGSGPAINAFAKSDGQAVRLIAGATAGGAQLVVKPEITSPDQLKGKTIATPQMGNTQDIALKKWLGENGLTAGDGPDDVKIANLDNPRTLDAFKQGTRGRRLAARAVELPAGAGRRGERAAGRGLAVAERQVPDHRAAGAHRVPAAVPGHRARPAARAPEGDRRGRGQPGRGQDRGQPGPAEAHRQRAGRAGDRPRVPEHRARPGPAGRHVPAAGQGLAPPRASPTSPPTWPGCSTWPR